MNNQPRPFKTISLIMLLTLALSAVGGTPVRASQTGPEAAPPAGLSTEDWRQIEDLLRGALPAQQAYLKASNNEAGDAFGTSVVLSGDTLVVGSWGEDSNATGVNGDQDNDSVPNSGAVYVFTRSGATWSQQAYIKASNPGENDSFGSSVAIDGDTLVVGVYQEDSNATGVDMDQNNNSAMDSGAAYVFTRSGATWSQQAYLKASNTQASDNFGCSVAVSGDTIVVGAWGEDSNATGVNGNETNDNATSAGAAYVFVRNSGSWSQQAYLKSLNTGAYDYFGGEVGISGNTIVVGATGEDSSTSGVNGVPNNGMQDVGAAYVFTRTDTTWSQQAFLKPSNPGMLDYFGVVAISGDTVVVGATGEASNATGVDGNQEDNSAPYSGAAYIFTRSDTTWSQQAYLKASNTETLDYFGSFVRVSGDMVVVGTSYEDSDATGVNGNGSSNAAADSGAAYTFTRSGTTWNQQAYLKASNTGANDMFGLAVAIGGNTIVVGAYREDSNATGVNGDQGDNSASDAGATYIFSQPPPTLTLTLRSVGAYDGYILESGENTSVGGTRDATSTTFKLGDEVQDKQYRAILSFNTASLPDDAVITKVTLKIRKQTQVGGNPFSLLGGLKVDVRKPYFGVGPGLVITDFQVAADRSAVGTFGTTPVALWYSAILNAQGRATINKTGITQFRLRFFTDDNNDNGGDYVKFYSGNYTSTASRPTLVIEYYVP